MLPSRSWNNSMNTASLWYRCFTYCTSQRRSFCWDQLQRSWIHSSWSGSSSTSCSKVPEVDEINKSDKHWTNQRLCGDKQDSKRLRVLNLRSCGCSRSRQCWRRAERRRPSRSAGWSSESQCRRWTEPEEELEKHLLCKHWKPLDSFMLKDIQGSSLHPWQTTGRKQERSTP